MRYFLPSVLLLSLLGCGLAGSYGPTDFRFDYGGIGDRYYQPVEISNGPATAFRQDTIGGRPALGLTTAAEFSDGFLELKKTYGRAFDFRKARYLHLRLYVPEGSWITALKLNFRDSLGNFGGIPEVANNFPAHHDEWFDVLVDLRDYTDRFRIWDGDQDADVLSAVTALSLNPYCANQEGESSIYLNYMALSEDKPAGDFIKALLPRPDTVANVPYHFDFDDDAELRRQTAYRTYEASNQAFARGIGGNPTRAIRMRGRPELNNIAWLPIISQVTGQPADFTAVSEVYFDYYLEPDYDEFDGSTLYLTSEHWTDILIDTTFYDNFTAGAWNTVRVPIADLDLHAARGNGEVVLPAVHELRLNLNYRPGRKNITMWIDNFGWR